MPIDSIGIPSNIPRLYLQDYKDYICLFSNGISLYHLYFLVPRFLHYKQRVISQVLTHTAEKIIFGTQSMILAVGCISILGSIVWGHHIYTLGLEVDTRAYFMTMTIMISLPTGTKIFNWLSTLLGARYVLVVLTYLIFIFSFIIMFTIGGSSGAVLGNAAVDLALHDTYYVIAHFHYILSLGAIIALFLGILFYQDIILGPSFISSATSRNARFHGLLSLFSVHLTFTPLHYLGFNTLPRRIPDYIDYIIFYNSISTTYSLYISTYIPILTSLYVLTTVRIKNTDSHCQTPPNDGERSDSDIIGGSIPSVL